MWEEINLVNGTHTSNNILIIDSDTFMIWGMQWSETWPPGTMGSEEYKKIGNYILNRSNWKPRNIGADALILYCEFHTAVCSMGVRTYPGYASYLGSSCPQR
eukprot:SAG31_NODE_5079_length_2752_cov_4.966114_2_plen_102_part_00